MVRLRYGLVLVGLTLVVLSIVLDVSFDLAVWSRRVGWGAIGALSLAVVLRLIERRSARPPPE